MENIREILNHSGHSIFCLKAFFVAKKSPGRNEDGKCNKSLPSPRITGRKIVHSICGNPCNLSADRQVRGFFFNTENTEFFISQSYTENIRGILNHSEHSEICH